MFCEGLSLDAEGRIVATGVCNDWKHTDLNLMMTGGNDAAKTSIYDPATGAWTAEAQMKIPRGYQSVSNVSKVLYCFVLLDLELRDLS